MSPDRSSSTLTPLKSGDQFSLTLDPPVSNLNSRPVPLNPPEHDVVLTLVSPIQPGVDYGSQVWKVAVGHLPDICLVAKIIQPSILDQALSTSDPEGIATHEAEIYGKLASKQGLDIPYFFGKHTIITPSGEEAWVLVLEYIPGPTVEDVIDKVIESRDPEAVKTLIPCFKKGLKAIRKLSKSSLAHGDILGPNFIFIDTPGTERVVIIDLGSLIPLDACEENRAFNDLENFWWLFARKLSCSTGMRLQFLRETLDENRGYAFLTVEWEES
ncbi:hypothetical protein C8R43DRAFT_1111482 [Mycena crocata]|nr:hypothetical protein C8R43DRAFT_1111482 [Mycena crocata]